MTEDVPSELLQNLDLLMDYDMVESGEDLEAIEEMDHLGESEEEP